MSAGISIRHAIFGVSGVVIASKLLGFLREMVIAERFGTSLEYDIYLIAVAAPIFFNVVIVRSVNFLIVPYLSRKLAGNTNENDWRSIWSVFNSLIFIVVLAIGAVLLLAPYMVRLIGSDLTGETFKTAVFYCRAISVLLLLSFLESFLRSALNVKKKFVYPALGTVILNITAIIIIYLFSQDISVGAILAGILTGTFIQVLFLLVRLFDIKLFKYFNFNIFSDESKRALTIGGAIVGVELLTSTYFIIDRYFAADLQTGVVSALNYCSFLVMLPVSVIGITIASVTFPYLSERAGPGQARSFSALMRSTILISLAVGVPVAIFYLFFAKELTAAVFLRGAFDLQSLEMTSKILVTLTPQLASLFLFTILIQACYAIQRQRIVFYTALMAVALKILLTWLFRDIFGYPGIGLATSAAYIYSVLVLIVFLARARILVGFGNFLVVILKLVIASVPIYFIGQYYQNMEDFKTGMEFLSKMRIIPAALISGAVFTIIAYLLKIKPIHETINDILGKMK